jgi:chromosome segregation ATPase
LAWSGQTKEEQQMDLQKEFEGMAERLRAHVGQATEAQRARLAECETKRARLEARGKDMARRQEELPREKETLLTRISRGMADGEDVGPLRSKLKELEAELAELKDIGDVLRREGLPRANSDCESARVALRDAAREAVREVRAGYVNSTMGIFAELDAANTQWRESLTAVLSEVGSVGCCGEDFLVPYPLSHQLRAQLDSPK